MKRIKEYHFYKKPLHILNYDFGDFYLYDTFIVGEVKEDVVISWEAQGKFLVDEFLSIYQDKSQDLIYISHRINDYSVVPSDWLKFKNHDVKFRGYGIVSYTKRGFFNGMLEKVFMPKLQTFTSLKEALVWAKSFETITLDNSYYIP